MSAAIPARRAMEARITQITIISLLTLSFTTFFPGLVGKLPGGGGGGAPMPGGGGGGGAAILGYRLDDLGGG